MALIRAALARIAGFAPGPGAEPRPPPVRVALGRVAVLLWSALAAGCALRPAVVPEERPAVGVVTIETPQGEVLAARAVASPAATAATAAPTPAAPATVTPVRAPTAPSRDDDRAPDPLVRGQLSGPKGAAPVAGGTAAAPARGVAGDAPEAVSVIDRAGRQLFAQARTALGDAPRRFVVDPPILAGSGTQTRGTVLIGERIAALAGVAWPALRVRPFGTHGLSDSPLLLVGTLAPDFGAEEPGKAVATLQLTLAILDLRTGRSVAGVVERLPAAAFDATPLPFFRDSPTWHRDRSSDAYARSTQAGLKAGDPVDPLYLIRLPAAAYAYEAIVAYDANRIAEAARLFEQTERVAEYGDLRVLNGLYLTASRLGREAQARAAADRIVETGLDRRQLPLKVPYARGEPVPQANGPEAARLSLWLRQIAQAAARKRVCLRVVAHSGRNGSAASLEPLTLRRAQLLGGQLIAVAPQLKDRVQAEGAGFRDSLIGLGSEDARDALDRRVEFRAAPCGAP